MQIMTPDPATEELDGDGICKFKNLMVDSGVETIGTCESGLIDLTQDVTCDYESVQFDQSVPTLGYAGMGIMIAAVAAIAAWKIAR